MPYETIRIGFPFEKKDWIRKMIYVVHSKAKLLNFAFDDGSPELTLEWSITQFILKNCCHLYSFARYLPFCFFCHADEGPLNDKTQLQSQLSNSSTTPSHNYQSMENGGLMNSGNAQVAAETNVPRRLAFLLIRRP